METIKVARALASSIGLLTNVSTKIALNLGNRQVAVLKMVTVHGEVLTAAEAFQYGLYRKSDQAPPELSPETVALRDTNWVILGRHDAGEAAYTGKLGFDKEIMMPEGFVLVSSPQVVIQGAQATNNHVVIGVYYTIKTVSAEEQARLMMKYPNK